MQIKTAIKSTQIVKYVEAFKFRGKINCDDIVLKQQRSNKLVFQSLKGKTN